MTAKIGPFLCQYAARFSFSTNSHSVRVHLGLEKTRLGVMCCAAGVTIWKVVTVSCFSFSLLPDGLIAGALIWVRAVTRAAAYACRKVDTVWQSCVSHGCFPVVCHCARIKYSLYGI
jgi:hypothetical protein